MLAPLTIGSQAHKELFCRVFIDTHAPLRCQFDTLADA